MLSVRKKVCTGNGSGEGQLFGFYAILNSVLGADLNEELTVEKRLEGSEGVNHADM